MYVKQPILKYRLKKLRGNPTKVKCAQDVMKYVDDLFNLGTERLVALYLDSLNIVVAYKIITEGTVNQMNPFIREIMRYAINLDACSIIVCHNHPTGNPMASEDDKKWTETLCVAANSHGITINDHIIVGRQYNNERIYFAFSEECQQILKSNLLSE